MGTQFSCYNSKLQKWLLCSEHRSWSPRVTAVAAVQRDVIPQPDSAIPSLPSSQFPWGLSVHIKFNVCRLYGTFSSFLNSRYALFFPWLTFPCLPSLLSLPLSLLKPPIKFPVAFKESPFQPKGTSHVPTQWLFLEDSALLVCF